MMIFELWVFTDFKSECFARRIQSEVRPMFHDMKIGEQRRLSPDKDFYLVRIA